MKTDRKFRSIFLKLAIIVLLSFNLIFSLPAFPGAEGWGSETVGGRGGKVYVVTTTAANGPGSFSAALTATGPRIITFRVSGVITSNGPVYGAYELKAPQSNFTIAGQTSPGGITLVGAYASFWYNYQNPMHDMVVRHLRFRSGNTPEHGLMMSQINNLVIDHCDFSGGTDETLDLCSSHDFTIQWSTICNSSTSGQTYGLIMAYPPTEKISVHHNLLAHHVTRFPLLHWDNAVPPDAALIDYRNNVCYNASVYSFYINAPAGPVHMNIAGNYFKSGPNTTENEFLTQVYLPGVTAYENDNVMMPKSGIANRTQVAQRVTKVTTPYAMPAVTMISADKAYQTVLDSAGAWPRDAMNTRTVAEVRAGTGQFGKQDDAKLTTGPAAPPDADLDGMPDCWEIAMGLNPNDSSDSHGDKDGDGYTNIEEYINDLALVMEGKTPQNFNLIGGCPADVENVPSPFALKASVSVAPTVYTGAGSIRIALSSPRGRAIAGKVRILDVNGRVMNELPAAAVLQWNGTGKNSRPLSAGLYIIQWQSGRDEIAQRKITITR
jgi:pectate lyase